MISTLLRYMSKQHETQGNNEQKIFGWSVKLEDSEIQPETWEDKYTHC